MGGAAVNRRCRFCVPGRHLDTPRGRSGEDSPSPDGGRAALAWPLPEGEAGNHEGCPYGTRCESEVPLSSEGRRPATPDTPHPPLVRRPLPQERRATTRVAPTGRIGAGARFPCLRRGAVRLRRTPLTRRWCVGLSLRRGGQPRGLPLRDAVRERGSPVFAGAPSGYAGHPSPDAGASASPSGERRATTRVAPTGAPSPDGGRAGRQEGEAGNHEGCPYGTRRGGRGSPVFAGAPSGYAGHPSPDAVRRPLPQERRGPGEGGLQTCPYYSSRGTLRQAQGERGDRSEVPAFAGTTKEGQERGSTGSPRAGTLRSPVAVGGRGPYNFLMP